MSVGGDRLDGALPAEPDMHAPLAGGLVAYRTRPDGMRIIPAPPTRHWMDTITARYAYKCLPMVIANQAGWFVLNPHEMELVWTGGTSPSSLRMRLLSEGTQCIAESHFGHGILTWRIPFVFRTPPDFNLLVRGPANHPKLDIYPLEGLVESDWSIATFTMNWQVLRPNVLIRFALDEPICMLVPQRKHDLEQFAPITTPIEQNPELAAKYRGWHEQRERFKQERSQTEWQRHYFRGTFADGTTSPEHSTRLSLREFEER